MPLDSAPGSSAPYARQGATLLSRQPVFFPDQTREDQEWTTKYLYLERRLAALRSWRWTWLSTWMELGAFFLPRRVKWWISPNMYNRGRFLNDQIIDSTGVQALNVCASGMWSGLTNPARPWYSFEPAIDGVELDADGREWLQDLKTRSMAVLSRSNFYSSTAQLFQDVSCFGTSPIIIYEDDENVIRCYVPCAGEYFLQSGSRFSVDTLYREFTLTVGQIVEMFQMKNCPSAVKALWAEGNIDREFVVAHAVEPNFPIRGRDRREVHFVSQTFTYREVYWLRGQKSMKPLSIRGFNERPFMAARWWLASNDAYGRSPCMDSLGDNKQIQTQTIRKAEFIEKGIRPPMLADPELKNEPASIMPGMVTFVNTMNGKVGFKPAFEPNATWLQHLTVDIKDVQQRIKEALYVPQFFAITQMAGVQPRNEMELMKRDLERLQMLGPVIELFENEVAGPALQRVVSIMQRKGMVKPMPDSLRGVPLKITYQSLARLAQKAAESIAMKDGFVTLGQLSAAAKAAGVPDPIRVVNLDESARFYLSLNNYPASCVFSETEVKRNDDAAAAARQQAQQGQQATELAPAAVDAAGILAKTPVGGGSMLNSILTGGTAPQ